MINRFRKLFFACILMSTIIFIIPITFTIFHTYASVGAANISMKENRIYIGYGCKLNITGTTGTVTWSSTDPKIATVSKSGFVTGKNIGTTTIIRQSKW